MTSEVLLLVILIGLTGCSNAQRIHHSVDALDLFSFVSKYSTSDECKASINKVIDGITKDPLKEYALRMIDANGKPSSGILQGNLHALGDFDECVSIKGDGFLGTYMTAQLPLSTDVGNSFESLQALMEHLPTVKPADLFSRHRNYNMNWTLLGIGEDQYWIQDLILASTLQPVYLGLCLPSTCTAKDAEDALSSLLDSFISSTTSATKFPRKYVIGDFVYNQQIFETSRYYVWNAGDYVVIALIGISATLGLLGSIIDYFDLARGSLRGNILIRIVRCFSLYTNAQKVMAPPSKASIIPLFGIKSISMIWVLMAHSYYLALFLTSNMNHFDYLDIYFDVPMLLLFSAELAVDTFFTVGGLLMSYLFLKYLDKSNGKFNPLMMYLHRYIRLTPTYGILILLFHTLPLKLAFGPFRKFADALVDKCDRNWWLNLLYINNFLQADDNCMGESWYLAVDFQLYLISPFIVWALWKSKKLGAIVFSACMLLSAVIPATITAVYEFPYMVTFSHKDFDWTTIFYTNTWNRPGPYFIGIIFGFFLYKLDKHEINFKMQKVYLVIGWTLSTIIGLSLMFGLYDIWPIDLSCYYERCFSVIATSFYSAFARTAWGIMVCWVTFVCMRGYGGIINSFLSWSIWAPISRVSYIMYLSHVHIQTYFYASRKQTFHFDQMLMIYWFFGHFMITLMLSFCISLLFESPFIGLEKIIFGRGEQKKSSKKDQNTTDSQKIIEQREEAVNNVSRNPYCQKDNGDLPQHNSSKTDLTKV